jgi:hypothetical protein
VEEGEYKLWVIWGGVFTDSRFIELEAGTEEFYGPFHTEEAALRKWKEATMAKVDLASHRLFVMRAQPAHGG